MGKFLKKERIMADNEAFDSSNFATKPLLFGKWNYEDLNISDKTLEIYISVHTSKQKVFVPHTAGRYQLKRFRKASMPLVERLMGTVAYHGRNTGKKLKAMRIVKQALDIIHHTPVLTHFKFFVMLSVIVVQEKTPPELVEVVLSRDKLVMFHHSEELIKVSTS